MAKMMIKEVARMTIGILKKGDNMFFEEYKSGNFDSEGNRVLSLSE